MPLPPLPPKGGGGLPPLPPRPQVQPIPTGMAPAAPSLPALPPKPAATGPADIAAFLGGQPAPTLAPLPAPYQNPHATATPTMGASTARYHDEGHPVEEAQAAGLAVGSHLVRAGASIGNALPFINPLSEQEINDARHLPPGAPNPRLVSPEFMDATSEVAHSRDAAVENAGGIAPTVMQGGDLAKWFIPGAGPYLGAADVAGNRRADVLARGGSELGANLAGIANAGTAVMLPKAAEEALGGIAAKVGESVGGRLGGALQHTVTGAGTGAVLPLGDAAVSAMTGDTKRSQGELASIPSSALIGAGLGHVTGYANKLPPLPPKQETVNNVVRSQPTADAGPAPVAEPARGTPDAGQQPVDSGIKPEEYVPDSATPEPAAEPATGAGGPVAAPAGKPVGFKTSRANSEYSVGENGSTQRNKGASGGIHEGDTGIKPPSDKTVYVSKEDAARISAMYGMGDRDARTHVSLEGDQLIVDSPDHVRAPPTAEDIRHRLPGEVIEKRRKKTALPYKTEPAVGLHPVEFGHDWQHLGSDITEVTHADPRAETRKITKSNTPNATEETQAQPSATAERGTPADAQSGGLSSPEIKKGSRARATVSEIDSAYNDLGHEPRTMEGRVVEHDPENDITVIEDANGKRGVVTDSLEPLLDLPVKPDAASAPTAKIAFKKPANTTTNPVSTPPAGKAVSVKTSLGKSVQVHVDPATHGETAGGVYHIGQRADTGKHVVFGRSLETTSPSKQAKSVSGAGQFRGLDENGVPVRVWKTAKTEARLPEFDTAEQARAHVEDLKTANAGKFRQRAAKSAVSEETQAQVQDATVGEDPAMRKGRPDSLTDRNAPREEVAADAAAGKYIQAESKVRDIKKRLDEARAKGDEPATDRLIEELTAAATEVRALKGAAESTAKAKVPEAEPAKAEDVSTLAQQAKARPESGRAADVLTTGEAGSALDAMTADAKRLGSLPEAKKAEYKTALKTRVESEITKLNASRDKITNLRDLAETDADARKLNEIARRVGSDARVAGVEPDSGMHIRADLADKLGAKIQLVGVVLNRIKSGKYKMVGRTAEHRGAKSAIEAAWPNAEVHFIPDADAHHLGVDGMMVGIRGGKDVILLSDRLTGDHLADTVGHEVFHHAAEEAGGFDEHAFYDAVSKVFGPERADEMAAKSADKGYTQAEMEEYLADEAGKLYVTSPEFRQELTQQMPSIVEVFKTFIRKIIDHIRAIRDPEVRAKLAESKFIRELVQMAKTGEAGASPLAHEYRLRAKNRAGEPVVREAKRRAEPEKDDEPKVPAASAFKHIVDVLPERDTLSGLTRQMKYDAGDTSQLFDSTADKADAIFSAMHLPETWSTVGQHAAINVARNTLLPSYIAGKSAEGRTVFDAGRAKMVDVQNTMRQADKLASPFLKLQGEDLAAVNKLLEQQRLDKAYLTPEELAKLPKAHADALKAVRATTDHVYEEYSNAVWESFHHEPVPLDQLAKEVRESKNDNTRLRLQTLHQIQKNLETNKRDGYVPNQRVGLYKKIVVTGQGENGRETLYLTQTEGRKEFKQKLAEVQAKYKDAPGVKIITDRVRDRDTDSVSITESDLRAMAEEAGLKATEIDRFLKAGIDAYLVKQRFQRFLRPSKDIPGYTTDYQRALAQYVSSASRSIAGMRFRTVTKGAFDGLGKSDRTAFDYWTAWQNHIFSPVRDLPGVKSLAFYHYLGADPVAAALNPLNVVTNTAPFLHAVTGGKVGSALGKTMGGAYESVIGALKGGVSGTSLPDRVANHLEAKGDVELADAVREAAANGVLHNQDVSDLSARANTPERGPVKRTAAATARAVGKTMGFMFQMTEQGGRMASFISGYRAAEAGHVDWQMARKYGYQGETGNARQFAAFLVDETMGVYGRVNRPQFFRDGKGIKRLASAAYTMRQFGVHQAHFMYKLAKETAKGDFHSGAALGAMVAMLGAAGGIWSTLPFGEALKTALNGVWTLAAGAKRDVDAELRRHFGTTGEHISEGFGGAAGRRLGVGNTVPSRGDAQSILGPAYGAAQADVEAAGKLLGGDPAGKLEGALTLAGGQTGQNIAKFLNSDDRGYETKSGTTLIPGSKLTGTDKAAMLIGAQTEHMHDAQRDNQDKQRLKTAVQDTQIGYTNRAVDLIQHKDNAGFGELLKEIAAHNQEAVHAGRYSEMIDMGGMRAAIKNELVQRMLGSDNLRGVPKKTAAEILLQRQAEDQGDDGEDQQGNE